MPVLVTDDGSRLHYEDRGRGPPVVLVHGWSLSSAVFATEMEALAQRFRVIALDLRGHGRSPLLHRRPFDLADLGRDLVALTGSLDLKRPVLAGWSMGAQVVLEAIPALSGRVAAVALVSATPRFTNCDGWPHGLPARSVEVLAHRVRRDPARAFARFFDDLFVPSEVDGAARARLAALRRAIPLPDSAAALAGLEALAAGDQRPRLGDLAAARLPVLWVHGGADPICLPGAAREAAARLPRARLELLPGAGHAPFLSRPAAVHRLLADFLEDCS